MRTTRSMLPTLTVNRQFMVDFIAKAPPCLALGLVEAEGSQCAVIALRPNEALPREVSALGFAFGHALYGGVGWEVVHFGFQFYGFATYNVVINPSNVLINPSDPVARSVLSTMIRTSDYFFFALNSDRGTMAFRSGVTPNNLIWLKPTWPASRPRSQPTLHTARRYHRSRGDQICLEPCPPGFVGTIPTISIWRRIR